MGTASNPWEEEREEEGDYGGYGGAAEEGMNDWGQLTGGYGQSGGSNGGRPWQQSSVQWSTGQPLNDPREEPWGAAGHHQEPRVHEEEGEGPQEEEGEEGAEGGAPQSPLLLTCRGVTPGIKVNPEKAAHWVYPSHVPRREYQVEMVRSALLTNTLCCLPTGLGKTMIAAVVMYNYFRWFPEVNDEALCV